MNAELTIIIVCSAALLYAYLGYPLLLSLSSGRSRRLSTTVSTAPTVSVIIPFHNEERWAARKLENTLSLRYPADRIHIVAVSDGSTDRTEQILRRYEQRVVVHAYAERRGKPTALNVAVAHATGDILVFTDANVLVHPEALQTMVRHYADPTVGGVSGQVLLQAEHASEPLGEGAYMRYERWLYGRESRANTMVGVDGAFFSIRRDLFAPLLEDTIADDFDLALRVVAAGRRVVYEPEARAVEVVIPDVRAEFRRKVRMIAGGYQTLWRHRGLFYPWRRPLVAFQLFSHKLLRWWAPLFLLVALLASFAAPRTPVITALLAAQLCFYGLALGGRLSRSLRRWIPIYVPYYFCAVNVAAACGLWRYLVGRQSVTWQKVQR